MAEIKKVIKNGTTYDVFNTDNVDSALSTSSTNAIQNGAVATALNGKQDTLVSGTNIKTINGNSVLGSGNLELFKTIQVTLTSAGWSSEEQTVTATGVTASNSVVISPAPESISDYATAMVYCSAQASNSLTFTCTTAPENDIVVNVLILN